MAPFTNHTTHLVQVQVQMRLPIKWLRGQICIHTRIQIYTTTTTTTTTTCCCCCCCC